MDLYILQDKYHSNNTIQVHKEDFFTSKQASDAIELDTIIADTGDMLLIKQQNKEFKASYNEFIIIERDNQEKIKDISIKLKRASKNLQKIANLKSLPVIEDINSQQISEMSIEWKDNMKLNDQRDMEDIQREFKKTYVKLNDQLERILQYSKEIRILNKDSPNGSSLLTTDEEEYQNEFNILLKRLQTAGHSYNRLKYIDELRAKTLRAKEKNDKLREDEQLILDMLDRNQKEKDEQEFLVRLYL